MRLLKHIFTYTSANLLDAGIPFLLLPLLTAYLLPEDYGKLSLTLVLIKLILPFVGLNIFSAVSVEYFKLSKSEFKKYLSSVIYLPIFSFCLFFLATLFFGQFVANWLDLPQAWIQLIPLIALLHHLPLVLLSLLQAKEKPINYSIFKIGLTIFNFGLSIFFIVSLKEGWTGRLMGISLAYFIFNGITILILFQKQLISFFLQYKYCKQALLFGIPLIIHSLSGVLISMSDRLFISSFIDNTAVGIYSVSFQVSSIVMLFTLSINKAWSPFLFRKLSEKGNGYQIKIVKITYYLMLSITAIFILFIIFHSTIFDIFIDSKYQRNSSLILILSLGFVFQGFYFLVTNYLFFEKRTSVLSLLTGLSAVCNLVLNYIMIPHFGMIGAAYASCISYFIFWLITWRITHFYSPMPWTLKVTP